MPNVITERYQHRHGREFKAKSSHCLMPAPSPEPDSAPRYKQYPDRGCPQATAYLGHQSRCLDCPFEDCLFQRATVSTTQKPSERNITIYQQYHAGTSKRRLAQEYGVCPRTIRLVIQNIALWLECHEKETK